MPIAPGIGPLYAGRRMAMSDPGSICSIVLIRFILPAFRPDGNPLQSGNALYRCPSKIIDNLQIQQTDLDSFIKEKV